MGKYISPCNECHHPRQANHKGISLATVKNAVIIKGKKEQGQMQGYTLKIGQSNQIQRKSNLTDRSRQRVDIREIRNPPAPLRHEKTMPTLSNDDYNCT